MKYLVISDIHGINEYMSEFEKIVEREKPDKIILLGDLLFHGYGYDSDNFIVAETLNLYKDKIIGIRGNNDISYDELSLDFPLNDYIKMVINDKTFIFTHGHLVDPNTFPCDVFVQGHTHINAIENGKPIYFNPGSLSLPRGNTVNSYGLITDDELIVKDTEGNIIKRLTYR